MNETCDVNFANSWIFASACQSAMFTSGPKSLSEAFLNLGAGGYNGFSDIIKGPIADQIAVLMTDKFSSGFSFNDASDKVRDDFSLLLESWFLRLVLSNTDIGLFSNNQNSNDPFYLIAPSKPSVTTTSVTEFTSTSATVGGNVSSEGKATITERGVYWGMLHNPELTYQAPNWKWIWSFQPISPG